MILGFTNDELTEGAHLLILAGVIATYFKGKRNEDLLDTQQKTIETLKVGFDACKDRLADLEKMVKKRV